MPATAMQRERRARTEDEDGLPVLRGKYIALDVETTGLDPYHGARLFCWGYYTEEGEWGFMRKTDANLRWVARLFADPSKTIIFHNAKFDLKMLSFEGIDVFNILARVECTLILSKLWNENGQHNLRYLSIRYLNRDPGAKDEVEDWLKKHKRAFVKKHGREPNFADAPIHVVKRRCIWDVESTLMLYAQLRPRIAQTCKELYETERQLIFVVIDMENHGVRVDVTRAKELRAEALDDLAQIQADLNRIICPLVIERKKKGKGITETLESFNANSSSIQLPAAFKKVGIELRYKTKPKKGRKGSAKTGGGNWSFDEYAMVRYVSKPLASIIRDSGEEGWKTKRFYDEVKKTIKKHKLPAYEILPPLILKYRELSKMVTTYYDHIIENAVDVHKTPAGRDVGILHCNFNQSEAMTGRFSASHPNLQNIPRILGPRECFIPRVGRHNWHLDYAQVEMRMFCHFAQDKKMAAAIDKDIHLAVACEIYEKDEASITKEQRKRAKGVNFGIIYGSGAATMAETLTKKGLHTSKLEAATLVASYHRKFPSVRRITNEFKVRLHRDGYVANPFGRRYHVPTQVGYKLLNYMCQGTSADIMKKAMVECWKWLRAENRKRKKQGKRPLKTRIIKTIHDEIVFETPPIEERLVIPQMMKIMEDLDSFFVPITVDAEVVTKRWSQKKKPQEVGCKWFKAS